MLLMNRFMCYYIDSIISYLVYNGSHLHILYTKPTSETLFMVYREISFYSYIYTLFKLETINCRVCSCTWMETWTWAMIYTRAQSRYPNW